MVWAIDRLGRSLIDLLGSIQHLEACGVDLYLDQQAIDTTTPSGKLLFQMTGAFAEFERSMIRQRVRAGLSAIRAKIERDGKFLSKAGVVRRRLGRPGAEPEKIELARQELAKGSGIGGTCERAPMGLRLLPVHVRVWSVVCWPDLAYLLTLGGGSRPRGASSFLPLSSAGFASGMHTLAICPGVPCHWAALRAASNGARSNTKRLRTILPSLTVTHSAAGALSTSLVWVS